jgi:hypothetical protein
MRKGRAFKILLLGPKGKKRTLEFKTEREAVEYLKATYATEAPLSFEYLDGTAVEPAVIERISRRIFPKSQ